MLGKEAPYENDPQYASNNLNITAYQKQKQNHRLPTSKLKYLNWAFVLH